MTNVQFRHFDGHINNLELWWYLTIPFPLLHLQFVFPSFHPSRIDASMKMTELAWHIYICPHGIPDIHQHHLNLEDQREQNPFMS